MLSNKKSRIEPGTSAFQNDNARSNVLLISSRQSCAKKIHGIIAEAPTGRLRCTLCNLRAHVNY